MFDEKRNVGPEDWPNEMVKLIRRHGFSKSGYKCLVIWQSEFSNRKKLIDKIENFTMEGSYGATKL